MKREVVLFWIGIGFGACESGSKEDVLLLLCEAVSNPHRAEISHGRSNEARLLKQFAARQFFWINVGSFPSALGQFESTLLNGVAELLDEVDRVAFNGKDCGTVVLVHNTVDALCAVVALDLVLAEAKPRIAVNLSAA